jgi:hypothetical protein
MTNEASENRLHQHMAQLVALEISIGRRLEKQLEAVGTYPGGTTIIQEFANLAQKHREVLEARLNAVADNALVPDNADQDIQLEGKYPMSAALRRDYVSINEAIIDYTTLRVIALRFRDSPVAGGENTADIADQHIRDYVAAVLKISQLIHDVVVWELEQEGLSCNCTCACCGMGVCICNVYNRETLSSAWAEAGPIADDTDFKMVPPRPGSNADVAGLQSGDLIVEADGRKIEYYGTLYEVFDGHKSGDTIELQVTRGTGKTASISVIRQ